MQGPAPPMIASRLRTFNILNPPRKSRLGTQQHLTHRELIFYCAYLQTRRKTHSSPSFLLRIHPGTRITARDSSRLNASEIRS